MEFVLDASMTLAWYFRDEGGETVESVAHRAAEHGVVVPAHWESEVANVLMLALRGGRTSKDPMSLFVEQLDGLPMQVDRLERMETIRRVVPLALQHKLTVYDALYLELAERRALPLATLDKALAVAARAAGIAIIGDEA